MQKRYMLLEPFWFTNNYHFSSPETNHKYYDLNMTIFFLQVLYQGAAPHQFPPFYENRSDFS